MEPVTSFERWYAEWAAAVNSREIAQAMYNAALEIALADADTSPPTLDPLFRIRQLVRNLTARVMENPVAFLIERDRKDPTNGRIYVQCSYQTRCTVTGRPATWSGRKWYLSDHMTDDEVVKTCYAAFKACVEHEVMEGFHYQGRRVFNPHTPFLNLLDAAAVERYRPDTRPLSERAS